MATNTDIEKRYRRYLRLGRSFSENTIDAYMRDIQKLVTFLAGRPLTAVTTDDRLSSPDCSISAYSHARRHASSAAYARSSDS